MALIDPEKLEINDVVAVQRTGEGGIHFLIGRVADVNYQFGEERHILVWGNWREERMRASVHETYEFRTHFDIEEPGLRIHRIGKWVNGEVKTRENEARYILDRVITEAKSTGLVPVKLIEQATSFLKGEKGWESR